MLVHSDQILSAAIKACAEPILVQDLDGTILIGSQGFADLYRCSVDELSGRSAYRWLSADSHQQVLTNEAHVIETGESTSTQETWDLGYEQRTMHVTRSPIRDAHGEVIGLTTSYKNISPIAQAFQLFEQNQKRFTALALTCPVGIFESNPDHLISFTNPAWEQITGFALHRVQGKKWTEFIHPDDRAIVTDAICRLDVELVTQRVDCRIPCANKSECVVELSLSRVVDDDGVLVSYIGSVVDLTFRINAENELRQSAMLLQQHNELLEHSVRERTLELQKLYDDLRSETTSRQLAQELLDEKQSQLAHFSRLFVMSKLSGVLAHELNQPLSAIQNYIASLSMMLPREALTQPTLQVLTSLSSEVTRAAKIIRHTREFVASGRYQPQLLNLVTLVQDTVLMLRGEARRRGMSIEVEASLDPVKCMIDPVRLQQVIVNLILNGLDAMVGDEESDKVVRLIVSSSAPHCIVQCQDSGCGVDQETEQRLFDAFYTTKSNGLGMGLSISRSIVEDHGGTLTYERRAPRGSTFTIRLPQSARENG